MKEYAVSFVISEKSDEFWEEVEDKHSPIERALLVELLIRRCLADYGIDEYHHSLQMKVTELDEGQPSFL